MTRYDLCFIGFLLVLEDFLPNNDEEQMYDDFADGFPRNLLYICMYVYVESLNSRFTMVLLTDKPPLCSRTSDHFYRIAPSSALFSSLRLFRALLSLA